MPALATGWRSAAAPLRSPVWGIGSATGRASARPGRGLGSQRRDRCPRIGMAWAPILLRAGGVILEGGGLLSQGALLARECGVPAVSEISDATTRIAEGARVVVDGTRGKVEILGGSGA